MPALLLGLVFILSSLSVTTTWINKRTEVRLAEIHSAPQCAPAKPKPKLLTRKECLQKYSGVPFYDSLYNEEFSQCIRNYK